MYCALHTIRRRVFCCSSGTILSFLNTAWVCAAPTLCGFSAPTVKLVAFIVLRYIVVVDVLLHRGEQLAAHRQRVPVVEHQIHGQIVLHDVLRDGIHRNAESLLLGVAVVSAGQQRKSHALAVVFCG